MQVRTGQENWNCPLLSFITRWTFLHHTIDVLSSHDGRSFITRWTFLHHTMDVSSSHDGRSFITRWTFLHVTMDVPSSHDGRSFITRWTLLHHTMDAPSSHYGRSFVTLWTLLHHTMYVPSSHDGRSFITRRSNCPRDQSSQRSVVAVGATLLATTVSKTHIIGAFVRRTNSLNTNQAARIATQAPNALMLLVRFLNLATGIYAFGAKAQTRVARQT